MFGVPEGSITRASLRAFAAISMFRFAVSSTLEFRRVQIIPGRAVTVAVAGAVLDVAAIQPGAVGAEFDCHASRQP